MCSRATAALVFCPRALMDAVWSRFLKLNSLLLLSSLPVIQRLVNGVQQNLQCHSRQQQVKRQNGLSLGWRLLFLLMIFIKCVMVSKHVSAASSGIAKDYNSNSQLIWTSSVFFFVVVVLWGFLCECNAQVPVTHKWRGTNKNRSYAHLKCLIFLWSDPYIPTYLVFVFLRPGLIVFAECNWALYQWCDVIIPFLGCGASEVQSISLAANGIWWELLPPPQRLTCTRAVLKGVPSATGTSHHLRQLKVVPVPYCPDLHCRELPDHSLRLSASGTSASIHIWLYVLRLGLGCWVTDGIAVKDYACTQI